MLEDEPLVCALLIHCRIKITLLLKIGQYHYHSIVAYSVPYTTGRSPLFSEIMQTLLCTSLCASYLLGFGNPIPSNLVLLEMAVLWKPYK